MEELHTTQRRKVEELKTKTNFYSTQSLLDRYDPDSPNQSPKRTTNSPKGSLRHRASQERADSPAGAPRLPFPRHQLSSDLQDGSPTKQQFSAIGLKDPNLSSSHSQFSLSEQLQPPFQPRPDQPPLPLPRQTEHKTPFDRILDLLVGEDENSPMSREALICGHCGNHNGLAPKGEVALSVRYLCPRCGNWNGKASENQELSVDREEHQEEQGGTSEDVNGLE